MTKNNEFMHVRNAVQSLLYSDHSLNHKNLIPAKEYFISRLTSGLQIFKNWISGSDFRLAWPENGKLLG